jgi:hypothetical protein
MIRAPCLVFGDLPQNLIQFVHREVLKIRLFLDLPVIRVLMLPEGPPLLLSPKVTCFYLRRGFLCVPVEINRAFS